MPKQLLNTQDVLAVLDYIDKFWPNLVKENKKDVHSLIGLPNPYIVPAVGEVFQEQYYWDSYPVVRALIDHPKYSKLAIGMVDNLLHLVERFGIIPNASRMYFLSRSQPPVLSSMVFLVWEKTKDKKWFKKALDLVDREYEGVWMGQVHLRNFRNVYMGLSRYYDLNALDVLAEAESGWDMTARFMNKCLDFLPVDLNSLLYRYEEDLEKGYEILGDAKRSKKFADLKKKRVEAMNNLMWDKKAGFFYDFNFVTKKRSHLLTVAGVFPMNVGLATKAQAERIVDSIERDLQQRFGVVQGARFVDNMQWDWPNGWAPMQLRTIEALVDYGYTHLAKRLITKWLYCNVKVFAETGYLWEKYDVVYGRVGVPDRYPTQPGFAWTNAVFIILWNMLQELEKAEISTNNR